MMGPADLKGLSEAPLKALHLENITIYNVNATANQTFACNPYVEVRAALCVVTKGTVCDWY